MNNQAMIFYFPYDMSTFAIDIKNLTKTSKLEKK